MSKDNKNKKDNKDKKRLSLTINSSEPTSYENNEIVSRRFEEEEVAYNQRIKKKSSVVDNKLYKEIIAEDGYIDKFIGDAVMAVFRGNDSLNRAAKASINIQKKMRNLPVIEEFNSFKPEVSIGINSGEMISGNIGSSTLKRLDYTVIGDVVNTAQRLQSKAEAGQIVLNEACKQQLSSEFTSLAVGEVNLKNKREPMMVYQIVSS